MATPGGLTQDAWLEKLCHEAAIRRYGSITPEVQQRLAEEFRLIKKYNLAGFLLLYHEVIKLGRDVMIQQGLSDPSLTLEENPPGRGRGSSVSLLIGYLIGLSHIDPLQYKTVAGAFPAGRYNDQRPGYRTSISRAVSAKI